MSFSSNVKAELCRPPISRRTEALAEAYGVLLYCNTFTGSAVRVVTESRDFAERLPRLFKKAFGVGFDETPNPDEPSSCLPSSRRTSWSGCSRRSICGRTAKSRCT